MSTGILVWVIATDDETELKGPVRVKLTLDQPKPLSAVVTGIEAPIRTQALQATVKLPEGVQLANPVEVSVPQLQEPLRAEVSGAVAAQVAGDVVVTGQVEVQITKPVPHERIRLGL